MQNRSGGPQSGAAAPPSAQVVHGAPLGVARAILYEEDRHVEGTAVMPGPVVAPRPPVPAAAPFGQPHRPVTVPVPGQARRSVPSLHAAPATAPPKPSWIIGLIKGNAKLLGLAAAAGIAYTAYSVYEYRQPYEWSGSVEAQTVSVGSRSGGRVKDVLVHEGQEVKAGAILVQLEPGESEAKMAQAEADVEAANAALQKLQNGARPEEIAQATARVEEARAGASKESGRAAQEQKDFARTKLLFSGGAVSAAERESKLGSARAAAGSAAEAVARAREAKAALKLLLGGTRPEDLRIAKANVAVAQAKLAAIMSQVEELAIRAVRDARVESITVRPGDILRENMPAAKLLEKGQLYVRIYVPETQLGHIRVGQDVPITVDSFSKRTFKGRVDHINEVGEFTPRRLITTEDRASEVFGARVALIDGDTELRAGMAAFIHVPKR